MFSNTNSIFDCENTILRDARIVFSGKLSRMTRREAQEHVQLLGGINQTSVTIKTDYLVLGTQRPIDRISRKHKKAIELIAAGRNIHVVGEELFYIMLKCARESDQ